MRVFALAAIAGLGLAAAAGGADARVWTDPAGRLTFDAPANWTVGNENSANATYIIVGTADNECHIISIPRPQLANAAARDIIRAGANDAQFGLDTWTQRANAVPGVFPNNSANVLSRSSETTGAWPIQRAEIQGTERLVHAAFQVRPGFEILTLCQTYEGSDPTEVYDAVIRSVGHPNDPTWAAAAEQQRVEREAAVAASQAAAAAAAAQNAANAEANEETRRRNNR